MQVANVILNADGDPKSRLERNRILRETGFKPVDADTASETLRLAIAAKPDLILIHGLPNGTRLKLRANPITAAIPIIELSESESMGSSHRQGRVEACLPETVAPSVLRTVIRLLLRARSSERQRHRWQRQNLRGGELSLKTLGDSIPGVLYIADSSGRLRYVNKHGTKLTGVSLKGFGYRAVVHPDDLKRVRAETAARVFARTPVCSTLRLRMADGSYRWFMSRKPGLKSWLG
jgi:PAS domain-containing protein